MLTTAQNNQKLICHREHVKHNVCCSKKTCKNWVEQAECKNCLVVAATNGFSTLHKLEEVYGLNRVKICQVERLVLDKIKQLADL